jgi:CHAT domain-containing protein
MLLFYDNLLNSKNIRDAFDKAQLEMSKKYDAFYWAAFVLI